jgi:hypothetical protein
MFRVNKFPTEAQLRAHFSDTLGRADGARRRVKPKHIEAWLNLWVGKLLS